MTEIQAITTDRAPIPRGPYSPAIRAGNMVFVAGQVPLDPATGKLVEGSIGDQTRRCLHNLQAVCSAQGAQLREAVRCGIYVTDMGVFAEVNEAYGAFFTSEPPARTTIGVASLPLGAQVEVDAIVALTG